MVELTKRNLRAVTLLTSQFFFALGVVLVAVFGLLFMYSFGWRVFLFVISLPLLVSFLLTFVCLFCFTLLYSSSLCERSIHLRLDSHLSNSCSRSRRRF